MDCRSPYKIAAQSSDYASRRATRAVPTLHAISAASAVELSPSLPRDDMRRALTPIACQNSGVLRAFRAVRRVGSAPAAAPAAVWGWGGWILGLLFIVRCYSLRFGSREEPWCGQQTQ